MAAGGEAQDGAAGGAGRRQWLPVLLSGLILTCAVPLSAWLTAPEFWWGHGWSRFYIIAADGQPSALPSYRSFFDLNGGLYSGTEYYLGWYWAAALAAGFLLTGLRYRRAARQRGLVLLLSGAAAAVLALALPLLTLLSPAPSEAWMSRPWERGVLPLAVIGVALAVTARLERSRMAALVFACYAVLAALAGWLLLLVRPDPVLPWLFPAGPAPGWESALLLDPLLALVLPGVPLMAAGLVGFAWRRRAPSPGAAVPAAG